MITSNDLTELLQVEKFRNWLVEQGTEIVGETRNDGECPIACYLVSKLPKEDEEFNISYKVSVTGYKIGVYSPSGIVFTVSIPTPKWASGFIERIDFIPLLQPIYIEPELTDELLPGDELVKDIQQCIPVSGDLALKMLDKLLS